MNKQIVDAVLNQACASGMLIKEDDGKMFFVVTTGPNTPWHVFNRAEFGCPYWTFIMNMFGMGESFIPLTCQSCYKVVVRPKNVKQLFNLIKIMETSDKTCKCGIETRATVNALYGGYFYNRSLEEGQECYDTVRMIIDRTLGSNVEVMLKRGCTEYELGHGDSLYWEPFEGQQEIEDYITSKVIERRVNDNPSKTTIDIIHSSWIKYAYRNGDNTYLELTGGKPLYPPYRTYHNRKESYVSNTRDNLKAATAVG